MMWHATSRRARTAVLAVVVWSAFAAGGIGGDALAGTTSGRPHCAQVTLAAAQCHPGTPVPSLQPRATRSLWQRLVAQRSSRTLRLVPAATCRPLRAVFYAATDWLRLATRLAANASPCAQYLISVPSLAADHTQIRPDQAWRIRALGPQFHALAEINMGAWAKWVASTGSTWLAAGAEARRRMAAAGFDVRLGDSWAVNEFSSAVRQGGGTARTDARDFVHGLYAGDGTQPAVRGAVFTIGMGQGTVNLSVYKTNLEAWLSDSAFWADMSSYVSDWSQELFGDYRTYGVASAPLATRRAYLSDYLEHVVAQANAGPSAAATARAYLQTAYSPLANAAWQFDTAFGWTLVASAQMQDYVSAQTYALRAYGSVAQPAGSDHFGFAWSPKNASGLSATAFDTQSAQLIDRLAGAIHDSDQSPDPSDPGRNACGIGRNVCATSLAGAAFNEGWKSFASWGQLGLAFATPAQSIAAGSPTQPVQLQLQTSGAAATSTSPVAVTLSASSATARFSTGDGAWAPTLQLTVPAGASTPPAFLFTDTKAGSPTITAAAAGVTSGAQAVTVTPAALASIAIAPASAIVGIGAAQTFTATGADAFGNPVAVTGATWALAPASLGTLSTGSDSGAVFTAGTAAGSGSVSATAGTVTAVAGVTVAAPASVPGSPAQPAAAPARSRGVALTWSAPASPGSSPVTGYRVYRGSRSGAETLLTSVGNVLTYTDTSARSGTTYYYELVAVSAAGQSPLSAEVSARAR